MAFRMVYRPTAMPDGDAAAGLLTGPHVRALVVGTGRHVPGSVYPDLPAVAATATAVGRRLVQRCGLAEDHLRTLIDPADPRELGQALTAAAREASDVLLIYYVGHGLVADDGGLHLATYASRDLDDDIPTYQALPFGELRGVLERGRSRLVIVVLDCCYAGRAAQLVNRRPADDFEATRRHGVYLLAAARGDQLAWAPPGEPFTAFSGELIRLLDGGDPTGPRYFSLDDVHRFLARRLPARGMPVPVRQAADTADGSFLAPNPAYRVPTAEGLPDAVEDARPSPYRGLAAFEAEDAALFFGREELTAELVDRLRAVGGEPLIVTGPSGSGKSSLLRAGVLPALRRAGAQSPGGAARHWVFTPGAHPLLELARRVAGLTDVPAERLRDRWRDDPARFAGDLAAAVRAPTTAIAAVIVVDQFEEVFTLCEDERERVAFIAALRGPTQAVVLGVRADFFGHCARFPELMPALRRPAVVGPMSVDQLRQVIERPAELAGSGLQDGLADMLLHDLGAGAGAVDAVGALPLLSHALLATWQRRENGVLTVAGYQATGGVTRALTNTAEATLAALSPAAREAARDVLLRMVRIGEGTGDARRAAPLAEILPDDAPAGGDRATPAAARAVVDRFVAARLLTVDRERIGITHEALIRAWPRLRGWIDADRTALLTRQQIAADADAWLGHDRDPSYLYTAGRLAGATVALGGGEHSTVGLAEASAEFLAESRRRDRRRARQGRQVIAALAVLLLLTAVAGGVAFVQGRRAADQRQVAERQRDVAVARSLAGAATDLQDTTVASQLSLAAYRIAPTPESRGAVLTAASRTLPTRLIAHGNFVTRLAYDRSGGLLATNSANGTTRLWALAAGGSTTLRAELATDIGDAAFRPDGRVLATASADRIAQLWDVSNPARPVALSALAPHTREIEPAKDLPFTPDVAFSRDGRLLATAAGFESTAALWDVSDPAHPVRLATLSGHTGQVKGVEFGPAGDVLVTASRDHTARLWNVRDPRRPRPLSTISGHTSTVGQASFDATGRRLVTASVDGTARVWDIRDLAHPRTLATLDNGTGFVYSAVFSPDGRTVASTSFDDQLVRLWDISDLAHPTLRALLAGHTDTVFRAVFSPDGDTIASGAADRTVRFWRLDAPTMRGSLVGHRNWLSAVAVSPARGLLATGSADHTARLWDVRDPASPRQLSVLTGHTDGVRSVAFSADGRRLVTGSTDTMARLWDITDPSAPRRLGVLRGHGQVVSDALFTPDGRTVVTAAFDRSAWLWDITDPEHPRHVSTLGGHQDNLFGLAIDPGGRIAVTASADTTGRIWDIVDPAHPKVLGTLTGHTDGLRAAAFSPDGRLLATGAADNTVRLWDLSDPARPRTVGLLRGHTSPVSALAFGADGRTIATGSEDLTARLWDIADPAHPVEDFILDTRAKVNGLAFTPGGDRLVTAGANTARLWLTGLDDALRQTCAPGGDGITPDEWAGIAPDLAPIRSCP